MFDKLDKLLYITMHFAKAYAVATHDYYNIIIICVCVCASVCVCLCVLFIIFNIFTSFP